LAIDRTWIPGDVIKVRFDLNVRMIPAFDGSDRVALLRGPVVLAQDSRLGEVDGPVALDDATLLAISATTPPALMLETYRLPGGMVLCDYASAGNAFSEDNQLCVWMKNQSGQ
jgi:hypothetical protein